MKKLSGLLEGLPCDWKRNAREDIQIERVVSDSRTVGKGDLFVALSGPQVDGHAFIREAIARGASAIISQADRKITDLDGVLHIRVPNTHLAFGILLSNFYERAKDVQLIGITGTNGKTTTAYLIHYLLDHLSSCGMIGTIHYVWNGNKMKAPNTTPGQAVMIPLLDKMAREGISYCVSEVSSHALDQERTAGIKFQTAVFTNLTQDHLDYHKTFENYYQAKRRLFLEEPIPKHRIVNADGSYGKRLLQEVGKEAIAYGISEGVDYRASQISVSLSGSQFDLVSHGTLRRVETNLPLYHNASNVLAALAALSEMGFSLDRTISLLQHFPGVPGRMERIEAGQPFHVFVDYAHTPDAFQNVFSSVRQLTKGKIIAVFGCGGDRDRMKRPLMGRIASESSEIIFLTDDNPRSEDSQFILDEIALGISDSAGASVRRVPDRRQAIRDALGLAQAGDLVLILEKAQEAEQVIGNRVTPFCDSEIVREILSEQAKITHFQ